jgi:hypothetical protein
MHFAPLRLVVLAAKASSPQQWWQDVKLLADLLRLPASTAQHSTAQHSTAAHRHDAFWAVVVKISVPG